jgi:hypothetical protein
MRAKSSYDHRGQDISDTLDTELNRIKRAAAARIGPPFPGNSMYSSPPSATPASLPPTSRAAVTLSRSVAWAWKTTPRRPGAEEPAGAELHTRVRTVSTGGGTSIGAGAGEVAAARGAGLSGAAETTAVLSGPRVATGSRGTALAVESALT